MMTSPKRQHAEIFSRMAGRAPAGGDFTLQATSPAPRTLREQPVVSCFVGRTVYGWRWHPRCNRSLRHSANLRETPDPEHFGNVFNLGPLVTSVFELEDGSGVLLLETNMTNTIPKSSPANWRMVYNASTKIVKDLFASTGATHTINNVFVADTKQACLDQAKSLGLTVPDKLAD
jgi:hypothetical protein